MPKSNPRRRLLTRRRRLLTRRRRQPNLMEEEQSLTTSDQIATINQRQDTALARIRAAFRKLKGDKDAALARNAQLQAENDSLRQNGSADVSPLAQNATDMETLADEMEKN